MKLFLTSGIIILLYVNSYSQNLDLVVTTSGDSIACKIDSISDTRIYVQIKTPANDEWLQTIYNKQDIIQYKYDCIVPSEYVFKDGTSKIIGGAKTSYANKYPGKSNLEKASLDELDFYLSRAKKTKKTGAIMSIAGPVSAAAGLALASATFTLNGNNGPFILGSLLFLGGVGSTVVGIPVLITGASRIDAITKIKSSKFNGITMELVPIGLYDYQTRNLEPGLSCRIRF